MIILYNGGGAGLTAVYDLALPQEEWTNLRKATSRLLIARGDPSAASLIEKYAFDLYNGTNYFNDEFAVLYARVSLEKYVELGEIFEKQNYRQSFQHIAKTISEIGPFTRFIAVALDTDDAVVPVAAPSPKITSEAVDRALADAKELINSRGAPSAVDRVHTALHGYLRAALEWRKIDFDVGSSITQLLKLLMNNESHLKEMGHHADDSMRILRALSTIVDSLNTLRNNASGAHPTDSILKDAEAMLSINAARTILNYLDGKLNS